MPLIAVGWTAEEEQKLVQLVQPHSLLYKVQDPSRKNIIARESTWTTIAGDLGKPVEECKKRWRGLRDSYMRSKRLGQLHPSKVTMFESLQFLDESSEEESHVEPEQVITDGPAFIGSEQVITDTDTQEYYEITIQEHQPEKSSIIKLVKAEPQEEAVPKKRAGGRKKNAPVIRNATPVKILPKPMGLGSILSNTTNGPTIKGPSLPKIMKYVQGPSKETRPPDRSQTIDKLIERVLKESTDEIDVFFRSMAASVKKLHPSLIPKVKMEICNVVAKYEMQSFEKQ